MIFLWAHGSGLSSSNPLAMEHEIAGLEWSFHPLAFNQEVIEIFYLALYFKQKKQMTNGGNLP